MDLPRERVRKKRVPHALHRMGLHLGPLRHCGDSAAAKHVPAQVQLKADSMYKAELEYQGRTPLQDMSPLVDSNIAVPDRTCLFNIHMTVHHDG